MMNPDKKRELGDILLDPFRFIFQNIGIISRMVFQYCFLPMVLCLAAYFYLVQGKQIYIQQNYDFFVYVLLILCIPVFYVHIHLLGVVVVLSAKEKLNSDQDMTSLMLANFKQSYGRAWLFFGVLFGILAFVGVILFLISGISFGAAAWIGILLMILSFLFLGFYGYILFLFAFFHFIKTKNSSFKNSFRVANEYLKNQWGNIFGSFFLANLISSFLSYILAIPASMITMIMTLFMSYQLDSPLFLFITGLSYMMYAFAASVMGLYINISTILKYYDVVERLEGNQIKKQIEEMTLSSEKYFENEGDY